MDGVVLSLVLNSALFLSLGALVGWAFRRRIVLAMLTASFACASFTLCFEHAVGRLPLNISLREFVNGVVLLADVFAFLCLLPTVVGAGAIVISWRLVRSRDVVRE